MQAPPTAQTPCPAPTTAPTGGPRPAPPPPPSALPPLPQPATSPPPSAPAQTAPSPSWAMRRSWPLPRGAGCCNGSPPSEPGTHLWALQAFWALQASPRPSCQGAGCCNGDPPFGMHLWARQASSRLLPQGAGCCNGNLPSEPGRHRCPACLALEASAKAVVTCPLSCGGILGPCCRGLGALWLLSGLCCQPGFNRVSMWLLQS